MKFTVSKDLIKKSITYLYSVTGESMILMGANQEAGKLTLESASNGIYVRTWHQVAVDALGILAVDGQHLASIRYPTDVRFEEVKAEGGSRVRIQSGNFRAEVATLSNGGYVKMQRPGATDQPTLVIPRAVLMRAVDATVFARPIKESATDGVTLRVAGGKLTMYALDGVRCSLYETAVDGLPDDIDAIAVLTPKFFDALKRLPGSDEAVSLIIESGTLRVNTDAAMIAYPKLQAVPHDVPKSVAALREESALGKFSISSSVFASTLDTVCSIVRGGAGHKDDLKFDVQPGRLRVSLSSTDGDAFDDVTLEGDTTPCQFTLSAKHIQEIADMIAGDVTITVYSGSIILDSDDGKSTLVQAVRA